MTTDWRFRLLLVVAGVTGLLLAKSVASFVAVGLVLALGRERGSDDRAPSSVRPGRSSRSPSQVWWFSASFSSFARR